MKILVLNGSPKRDKSDTMHITRAFLNGMKEAAPQDIGKRLNVRGIMFRMSEGISTKPYASPPRILPESRYRTAPSGFIRIRTMPM